jgi:predicted helicase
MVAYFYCRNHISYIEHNVIKLGIATNIPERNNQYITGEFIKGFFELVIEIPYLYRYTIENSIKKNFNYLHKYINGGTEFFEKKILKEIIPYLQNNNIKYKILTYNEINELEKKYRLKQIFKKINKYQLIKNLKNIDIIKPNEQQKDILNNIENFYNNNNIGKIIWSCGLGKALLSILIIKKLNYKNIVIGVPTKYLQKQFSKEILKIYPDKKNILYVGGENDNDINSTTNIEKIKEFLNTVKFKNKFIITTYNSCNLLLNIDFTFDLKIGDEAHHLVGQKNQDIEKSYNSFHSIISKKTLFMTATEKNIENSNTCNQIYSMNNINIFGKYIDKKSVYWAIENKKITDYNLLVLKNSENEVNEIINYLNIEVSNKELFLSAFMTLKSIELYKDLTHILIYTNNTRNAELLTIYIKNILQKNILQLNKNEIYNNTLHSNNYNINLNNEIDKFKNSKFGIISCVYIFGEGFDLPKLNGVVFAENMNSDIRIVQSALRPNRLDKTNLEKKAYIIIPYIDNNNWTEEHKTFYKVRLIISKIRNVDKNIEQKIIISSIIIKKEKQNNKQDKKNITKTFRLNLESENVNELLKLKMRLRFSKTLNSNLSEEQDEYNYFKQINKDLNIQSKEEYANFENKTIQNPEEYFKLKGVWNNWYDFIGIDTLQFIQNKQDWIKFCKKNNIQSINDYNLLCNKYKILPKNPADFYINFTNIPIELNLSLIRR